MSSDLNNLGITLDRIVHHFNLALQAAFELETHDDGEMTLFAAQQSSKELWLAKNLIEQELSGTLIWAAGSINDLRDLLLETLDAEEFRELVTSTTDEIVEQIDELFIAEV